MLVSKNETSGGFLSKFLTIFHNTNADNQIESPTGGIPLREAMLGGSPLNIVQPIPIKATKYKPIPLKSMKQESDPTFGLLI